MIIDLIISIYRINNNATDELIRHAFSFNNKFKTLPVLVEIRNMNLENSNLLSILKLIMTEKGYFINEEIYTNKVYLALKSGNVEEVFSLMLFSTVIPGYWLKKQKVYKYARRSLKMLEILKKVNYLASFFIVRDMISAGYITNALYVFSDSENDFLDISSCVNGYLTFHLHKYLIDMYKLAIQKYKSHRLFNFLFQKYGFINDEIKTVILSFLKDVPEGQNKFIFS